MGRGKNAAACSMQVAHMHMNCRTADRKHWSAVTAYGSQCAVKLLQSVVVLELFDCCRLRNAMPDRSLVALISRCGKQPLAPARPALRWSHRGPQTWYVSMIACSITNDIIPGKQRSMQEVNSVLSHALEAQGLAGIPPGWAAGDESPGVRPMLRLAGSTHLHLHAKPPLMLIITTCSSNRAMALAASLVCRGNT